MAMASAASLLDFNDDFSGLQCFVKTPGGREDTTFQDVRRNAHAVARRLLAHFDEKEVDQKQPVIAAMLPNSAEHVVVHYAAAIAGAVIVNINTRLTAAEVRHQLDDADVSVLVADTAYATVAEQAAADSRTVVVWVGGADDNTATNHICQLFQEDPSAAATITTTTTVTSRHISNQQPFEMLYTSGTSGKPKGVVHTQKAVMQHAATACLEFKFHANDVWLHVAPIFHAMDLFAVFAMPLCGAAQAMCSQRAAADPRELLRQLRCKKATCTALAPTSLRLMLDAISMSEENHLHHLRLLSTGGQALDATVVKSFARILPWCTFFSDYGMTEAGGKLCVTLIDELQLSADARMKLLCTSGRPFACVDVRLLSLHNDDADDDVVAIPDDNGTECCGEIVVRGLSMFRGYFRGWNEDADIGDFTNGWFRTGDIAQPAGQGFVRIVDRKKDLIITGGENVYTAEVELVLTSHPGVSRAAVYGVPHVVLGEVVKALVVLRQDDDGTSSSAEEEDLRAFVASRLADYKVPRIIEVISFEEGASLPQTASMKIKKNELRARDSSTAKNKGPTPMGESPTSVSANSLDDVRRIVQTLVSNLLPHSLVDDTAPLMQAGLTSHAAVDLHTAVLRAFPSIVADRIPALLVFQHPTMEAITRYIHRQQNDVQVLNEEMNNYRAVISDASSTAVHIASMAGRSAQLAPSSLFPSAVGETTAESIVGRDAARRAPYDRFGERTGYFAHVLAVPPFVTDAGRFTLTSTEAACIDPCHLLALEDSDAVLATKPDMTTMARQSAAVVVATMWDEMRTYLAIDCGTAINAAAMTGYGGAFLCGRLSYVFNFGGTCAGVDTACSGSLVATRVARLEIVDGQARHALVPSANASLRFETTAHITLLGALSAVGRCQTLDASADGFGRGEASVAMLLVASDADENSPELGASMLLLSAEVNQDGRSTALTAPSGPSQARLVRTSLALAASSASAIAPAVHNLHGTGTPLGDPIEVAAFVDAMSSTTASSLIPPTLTATKSIVGHTEAAAGLSSLAMLERAARAQFAVPLVLCRSLNAHVAAILATKSVGVSRGGEGSAIASLDENVSCYCCSAFGMSGVNAHATLRPHAPASCSWRRGVIGTHRRLTHGSWVSVRPPFRALVGSFEPSADVMALKLDARFKEHRISGQSILPGAASLEALLATSQVLCNIRREGDHEASRRAVVSVTFARACNLSSSAAAVVVVVEWRAETGATAVRPSTGTPFVTSHVQRIALQHTQATNSCVSTQTICVQRASTTRPIASAPFYREWLPPAGLQYGPSFAVATSLRTCGTRISAQVVGDDESACAYTGLAPGVLDAGLHASLARDVRQHSDKGTTGGIAQHQLKVPSALRAIVAMRRSMGQALHTLHVQVHDDGSSDHDFRDNADSTIPVMIVGGLVTKSVATKHSATVADADAKVTCAYEVAWRTAITSVPPSMRDVNRQDESALSLTMGKRCGHVFNVQAHRLLLALLDVVQTRDHGYLRMLTHGALLTSIFEVTRKRNRSSSSAAGAWAALRTASLELSPTTTAVACDGDDLSSAKCSVHSAPGLMSTRGGFGVAVRSGSVSTAQLVSGPTERSVASVSDWQDAFHLIARPRGSIASLRAVPVTSALPSNPRHAIHLSVFAVGLNFRDLLNVLDLYPGDPGAPGGDCAGAVAVSSSLPLGTALFGQAFGSLGTRVVDADARLLAPMPASLCVGEAASIPTVTLTADACLALMTRRTTVPSAMIVHGVSGGVGLASARLARHLHLAIHGSAGTSTKRSAARRWASSFASPCDSVAVASSRSTCFAETFATLQTPTVLALNSLTSTGFVAATMANLAPTGTFAEISKRNIWRADAIASERWDLRANIVALDLMHASAIEQRIARVAAHVHASEAAGSLPLSTFALVGGTRSALRTMAKASHIGKLIAIKSAGAGGRAFALPAFAANSAAILGGLGVLGGVCALWLIEHACVHNLVLSGRSGRAPPRRSLAWLEHAAPVVTLSRTNAACSADARMFLGTSPPPSPLAAVLQAGGVLADASLANQRVLGVRAVLPPKENATLEVLASTQLSPMRAFVGFSSIAGLLGNKGQLAYAFANEAMARTLDGCRLVTGMTSSAIQYGAWGGESGGMAASVLSRIESAGFGFMQERQALAVLALTLDPTFRVHLIGSAFDFPKLVASGAVCVHNAPFFQDVCDTTASKDIAVKIDLPTEERAARRHHLHMTLDATIAYISRTAASVLGRELDVNEPFMDAGLDSLTSVELRQVLNTGGDGTDAAVALSLPATAIFDYPSIASLAAYVASTLTTDMDVDGELVVHKPEDRDAMVAEPLVLAHITANMALATEEMCEDAIAVCPLLRHDVDGGSRTTKGGGMRFGTFLANAGHFDAPAFRLTTSESRAMDPQQRMLCVRAGEALSTSVEKDAFPTTCVAIGIAAAEYLPMTLASGVRITPHTAVGGFLSVASGRLSYLFNLGGAAVCCDTACSSALTAMSLGEHAARSAAHSAAPSLLSGAANLLLMDRTTRLFEVGGFLAPDGRCKALDAGADGYVRSEACTMVAAVGGGDGGVIVAGSGVNQDGRSSALTAPNGPAQQRVLAASLRSVLDRVMRVDLHGTGTPLGDPIEVGAVAAAVLMASRAESVSLAARKSAWGHAEPASGGVGLAALALRLDDAANEAIIHLRSVNAFVAASLPESGGVTNAYLARQHLGRYEQGTRAAGGVSAFAFQGTNANVALARTHKTCVVASSVRRVYHPRFFWISTMEMHALAVSQLSEAPLPPPSPLPCEAPYLSVSSADLRDVPSYAFLRDHVVAGVPLLPAAALLDAAFWLAYTAEDTSTTSSPGLVGTSFVAPVNLASERRVRADVSLFTGTLLLSTSDRLRACTSIIRHGREELPRVVCHCQKPQGATVSPQNHIRHGERGEPAASESAAEGFRALRDEGHTTAIGLPVSASVIGDETAQSDCTRLPVSASVIYAYARASKSLEYGAAFQSLHCLRILERGGSAHVRVKPEHSYARSGWMLHPSLLDAAFQAAMLTKNLSSTNHNTSVPASLDMLTMASSLSVGGARISCVHHGIDDDTTTDHRIMQGGNVAVMANRMVMKEIPADDDVVVAVLPPPSSLKKKSSRRRYAEDGGGGSSDDHLRNAVANAVRDALGEDAEEMDSLQMVDLRGQLGRLSGGMAPPLDMFSVDEGGVDALVDRLVLWLQRGLCPDDGQQHHRTFTCVPIMHAAAARMPLTDTECAPWVAPTPKGMSLLWRACSLPSYALWSAWSLCRRNDDMVKANIRGTFSTSLSPTDMFLSRLKMSFSFEVDGELDEDRLRRALAYSLRSYPSLAGRLEVDYWTGRLFLKWGEGMGVVFRRLRRRRHSGGGTPDVVAIQLLPSAWRLIMASLAVLGCLFAYLQSAVSFAIGAPVLTLELEKSIGDVESGVKSYVHLQWAHAVADGTTINGFVKALAAAYEMQAVPEETPAEVMAPSPEAIRLARELVVADNNGGGGSFYAPSGGGGFAFRRFFVEGDRRHAVARVWRSLAGALRRRGIVPPSLRFLLDVRAGAGGELAGNALRWGAPLAFADDDVADVAARIRLASARLARDERAGGASVPATHVVSSFAPFIGCIDETAFDNDAGALGAPTQASLSFSERVPPLDDDEVGNVMASVHARWWGLILSQAPDFCEGYVCNLVAM
ncbi:AMP-binding enzyme [Pycnococcus provasolii]